MKAPDPFRHLLALAALFACAPLPAETPAPASSLNATHAEDRFGLALDQLRYRERVRIRELKPQARRRVEQRLQRERLQLEQLQQRQGNERRTLQRRLQVLPPGTAPAAAVPLQDQRFRQERRSQELHFKLSRPPHP